MKKNISWILTVCILLSSISSTAYAFESKSTNNTKKINNLVIFIDFNDTNTFKGDEIKGRQVEATFNDFADDNNDKVSNTDKISLKSYMYDISKGNTIVDSTFYPKSKNSTGYISYKTPKDKDYYANQPMGGSAEHELIEDAFNSVKDEITFSGNELDSDGDGKIDSLTFVFSGIPAVNGGSILRQHKAQIPGIGPKLNGKEVEDYNIVGEGSSIASGSNIYNKNMLGTIVHEFLHMIKYPDLYKNGTSSNYVGIWDLMANSKLTPQLPLVYSRNAYGKVGLNVQEITESGVYTLSTSSNTNSKDIVAFKIKSKLYPNEYFMIEYRKNDKKWDSKLPGSGIIVYRINEDARGDYGNDQKGIHVYVFRPSDSSANSGSGNINDAYLSKESSRTTFGTKSNNPYEFNSNNIYFSNGANSDIFISDVGSAHGDKITFKVDMPKENDPIEGEGTLSNPYKIKNVGHIFEMNLNSKAHFILANDIDLSSTELKPIGNIDKPFEGSFDGKGHTISNLTINSKDDTTGFISELGEKGIIKNINFKNIDINSEGYTTGGIVGRSSGTIENINVSGNISSSSELAIGGIAGETQFNSKLLNCSSEVKIVSKSVRVPLVGGLVGNASDSLIKNNYFKGTINAQPSNKVGAVFGRNIISYGNEIGDSIDNVWNITTSNIKNGVSQITMPQFGETDKGVVGIELLKNVNLKVGSVSSKIVKYTTPITGEHKITSNNKSIVTISNDLMTGVSKGSTSVLYELILGKNKITENIDVNVEKVGNDPTIKAEDKTIKVGEKFEPLRGVSAIDKEDGNITSKITIKQNTVNTKKAGTYNVVYSVTDSDSNTTTKKIKVVVNNVFTNFTVNSINNKSKTITGTGLSGATVKAYVGSKQIGKTTTVNSSGKYTIDIPAQSTNKTITVKISKTGYVVSEQSIKVSGVAINSKKYLTKDIYRYDLGKGKYLTYINNKGYSQYSYLNTSGKYAFTPSSWMMAAGLNVTMPTSANGYTMMIDNNYIQMHNEASKLLKKIESGKIARADILNELDEIEKLKNQDVEIGDSDKISTRAASPKKALTKDIYRYDAGKGKYLTYINGKGYSQYSYLNTSGKYAFTPSSWMSAAGLNVTMPTKGNGYTMKITNPYIEKYNSVANKIQSYAK